MNNTNETIGVKVLSITPFQNESDVNINSSIDVTFSSDINPATFDKNVVVLEDCNRIYKGIESLRDYSKYAVVKGNASYSDKVFTFTPAEPFKTNSCYIVMLNEGISDITGNRLVQKYISCFYTESVGSLVPVEILSPKYGLITSSIPEFTWINNGASSFVFQISKNNSFEVLIYDKVITGNQVEDVIRHTPEFNAKEGMYFVRVKHESGDWSNIHQIFIKPITDAVVAEQDISDIQNLDEFLDGIVEPLEILEMFPPDGSVNNTLQTNIIYLKLKGNVDKSRINIPDCVVYGVSTDEDHEEYAHGVVSGTWSVVYDNYYDVTYIIFTPSTETEESEEEDPENTNTEEPNEPTVEPSEPTEEPNEPTGEPEGENTEDNPNTENPDDQNTVVEPNENTENTEQTENNEEDNNDNNVVNDNTEQNSESEDISNTDGE